MESGLKPPPAYSYFLCGGRYFQLTRIFIESATVSAWSKRRPPIERLKQWNLLSRKGNRTRFIPISSGLGEQCALHSVLVAASALFMMDVSLPRKRNLPPRKARLLRAETQTLCFWMKSDRHHSSLTSPTKFRIFYPPLDLFLSINRFIISICI